MAFGLAVFLIPLLSHHEPYEAGTAFRLAVFLISLLPHARLSRCHGFRARCITYPFIITSWILSSWHGFQASCLPHSYLIMALTQAVFLAHLVLIMTVTCRASCLAWLIPFHHVS
jgi:hypothetical protein